MRFDYTKDKAARYMTIAHRELNSDYYYFHYFSEAKEMFDKLRNSEKSGSSISIYDIDKDIRKKFAKI